MERELNIKEALEVLENGEKVECQLSYREDNREVVSSKDRLEYLYNLSAQGIQKCIIFKHTQDKVNISEDAIEMSFDEAYQMVFAGDLVYYQEDGEEKAIHSISELINLRRAKGENLFLYWHE